MSGELHLGDEVTQYGNGNIGIIKGQGASDPQLALRELIAVVNVMRKQVSPTDRQIIDESLDLFGSGRSLEKGTLRRALSNVAGVAAVVGQVGVPVIDSVRKVMAAFGV